MILLHRLMIQRIQAGHGNGSILQGFPQRFIIHQLSPGRINEITSLPALCEELPAAHSGSFSGDRNMKA